MRNTNTPTPRSYRRRPVSIVKAERWTPSFDGVIGCVEWSSEMKFKDRLYTGIAYSLVAVAVAVGFLWVIGLINEDFKISNFNFLNDRAFGLLVTLFGLLAGFFFKIRDKK